MKYLALIMFVLAMSACSVKQKEVVIVSFPNGQPQKVQFLDKGGNCVKEAEYYDSGELYMEGPMKDGVRQGKWTAYFRDGKQQSVGYFVNGVRDGAAIVYRETGQLYMEGQYKDGKQCGKWKYYDEQSYLIREIDYDE